MGALLHRLGSFAVRRRWTVVLVWLAVLAAAGISAATFGGNTTNSFTIPGTESQKAIDLLDKHFPGAGGASARVVVAAPSGHTLVESRFRTAEQQALNRVAHAPQVIAVTPFAQAVTSADGRIAFVDIQYAVTVDKVSSEAKKALRAIGTDVQKTGLDVQYSGGVISTTEDEGNGEIYGLLIAFLVLAITMGGLVAAGMPLLTAGIGVAVGLLGIKAMSGVVSLNSSAPTLALMLSLAVGIDYTLFILARHKQGLADGLTIADSLALATATAGGAVVFAGLTVIIALAALAVVGIPFLTGMGIAAAAGVAIVVMLALTFVPAVLSILGSRIHAGRIGILTTRAQRRHGRPSLGTRWSAVVTRRPWATITACVLAVSLLSIPVLDLQLGLPDDSSKPTATTERRAYDLITTGFGAGYNGPLTMVISHPGHDDATALAKAAMSKLEGAAGIARVGHPAANETGDVAILQVTPRSSPGSEATKTLVATIRSAARDAVAGTDVDTYVTGPTASNIDVSNKLSAALPIFLILIVGVALLLLMFVFRSLLVPLKAVLGFLFSIAASMGVTVFVFQHGHLSFILNGQQPGPIVSFLPVLLVSILFGLAMDYEVFLVSRIREDYVHRGDPEAAITAGMTSSARVVSAAGIIMISVFGSFVLGDDAVIKPIGLALGIGVAVDAFVVRMTFVPAVLRLFGHRAWQLPRWLDRILPDLDLEGSSITTSLGTAKPTDDATDTDSDARGARPPVFAAEPDRS
ncbi:MMPL family transporter [uncultured Jatrophihabitans sp.]|uniref:MMPL family transporter n=1 Tax=uncultured Jatrophihabitans sp. TaxID=1610747 RepID=UPI0035CB91B0